MIDAEHQIGRVRRTLDTRTLDGDEARVMTLSQAFPATPEELWSAVTDAGRIPHWFLPVSGDLREGGSYQLEGNAGGTIERCDPPRSFRATWEFGGEVSRIEVSLAQEAEDRTRLTLEHVAHVDAERWAEFGPGATGIGWDMGLLGLATYISSGASVDPQESAAWTGSPEGREFMADSGEAWREVSVSAGTPPDEAHAAADRVLTAYTGG